VGNPADPNVSDVVDPLWRRVLNDRFTILEPIGSGGMGKVYKAVQAPLDRVVALKVLNSNRTNEKDPEFRKRFFLEASLTARLRHPNTITVIDYGQTPDGIFFIAMEYLEGQTLSQLLAKSGPLRWTRCLNIAMQICRSLREAHKLGVVHRDLKPSNVMLISEDQEMEVVKVLDFGLVKSFISEEEPNGPLDHAALPFANVFANPEVTPGGMFIGSPQYMAPEQARNRADHRSDIYSLGATAYQMLVGRPPFWAKDAVEVIFKHINEPVPPMRSVRPDLDIPPEVEAVWMKCLEKQPSHRFQSMDEVLEAIRRAAMAVGASSTFTDQALGHPGIANTPAPMSSFEVTASAAQPHPSHASHPPLTQPPSAPPPAQLSQPSAETTLALDISVVPPPQAQPTVPWYTKRSTLLAGAGGLAVLLLLALILGLRGSKSPGRAQEPKVVAKVTPPVQKPAAVEASRPVPAPAPVEQGTPAPKTVKFRVSSEPSGATVSMGGHVLGTTPLSFDVAGNADGAATAELLFAMKGYHPMTVITGGAGLVVLSEKLQPQQRSQGRTGGGASERREAPEEKPERAAVAAATPDSKRKAEPDAKLEEAPKAVPPAAETVASLAAATKPEPVAATESDSPKGPVEFNPLMTAPVKLSGPDPEYTQKAIDHSVEGAMAVRCIVAVDGSVNNCRVLKGLPFMDRPVVEALQRRRYKPATLQGKAVDVFYIFKLTLNLPR
jgi:serine/threonine-protein kinase